MLCERTSKADLFERQRVIRLLLEHKPGQEDVRLLAVSILCEGVQFISERSAGRGFEALLPPKVPLHGVPCGAYICIINYI